MESLTPDELKEKLDAGETVFLKLWKPGCGACKLSTPAIERLEKKHSQGIHFAQIDTQEHQEILEISGTDVLPVFFFFKAKKMVGKHIGFKGLKKLEEWLDGVMV